MEFLQWLEQTSLSTWVREAPTVWAYATVLLLHTVGMGLTVGVAAGIDLRILGVFPGIRLAPLERFFPLLWGGFSINAVTGTLLLMQDATTKLVNWDFYLKMAFIAIAITTLRTLRTRVFRDPRIDEAPLPSNVRTLAAVSLLCWIGAIITGRLLAYVGLTSGFD
jgi:hypothetical protein